MSYRFDETFCEFVGQTFADGDSFGAWNVCLAGFGGVGVTDEPALHLTPSIATNPSETHAALVVGPSFPTEFIYSCRITTLEQLRRNNPPNNHEVAWVVWNYINDAGFHEFHYLSLKPRGWELGQTGRRFVDNGYQNFIATDGHRAFPIETTYLVTIRQSAGSITIEIDGEETERIETEIPGGPRQIGIYTEDASIIYSDVSVEYDLDI